MDRWALLVVDMNQGLFDPKSRGGVLHRKRQDLVIATNNLAHEFRKKGHLVVWITQRNKDDLSDAPRLQRELKNGQFALSSEGWKLLPELEVVSGDCHIVKTNYSAFFRTNLDALLQENGVFGGLVFVGANIPACLRCTTIDAYQHNYHPLIWAREGIASSLPQFDEDTIRYLVGDKPGLGSIVAGLLTIEEIVAIL